MFIGLVWMATANAAVLLAARAALRGIATGRPAVDLVLFLLLRFAFIMGLVLSAGIAGLLTPAGLGVPCLLLLAALLARGEHRGLRWALEVPPEIPRWLLLLGGLLALRCLLQIAFYSPINGDATSYHLPKLGEWVRTGSVFIDVGNDVRAWFPAGFELVEAWWVVFLHHDALIEAAGLEFLLLASASTWSLARWAGARRSGAFAAALAIATVPGLSSQAVSCLNDGAAAGLVLAGAALIAARVPFPLLVFLGAMGIGVKPTVAYAVPGLLLLLWCVRKEPRLPNRAPRTTTALLLLGLGLGIFWYARTWYFKGSPIFPVGTPELVGVRTRAAIQRLGPSLSTLLENLRELVDHRLHDRRRAYHPLMPNSAAWGIAVVACGLPAALAFARRSGRFRALAAGLALSLISTLAQVIPDSFNLRFILSFTGVPAVALGLAVDRFHRLRLPVAAALILALLTTNFTSEWDLDNLVRQLRHDRHAEVSWLVPVPVEERVGTYGRYDPWAYLLYGPGFQTDVVYIRGQSSDALVADMQRAKIRLLYTIRVPSGTPEGRVLADCVKKGTLTRLSGDAYYLRSESR